MQRAVDLPSHHERASETFLCHFVTVFFDDILVYSPSFEDHLTHLTQVFDCLTQGQFFLKATKCLFAQQQLEYLGHIVSHAGVDPDPAKIEVAHSPIPIPYAGF